MGRLAVGKLSRAWHTDVAESSGFRPPAGGGPGPAPQPGDHPAAAAYLAHHLPFYQRLYAQRLVIG